MVFSPNQEVSTNPSKRCKFFSTTLKDAFANCHIFKERHSSTQILEEEDAMDVYDDEEEVLILIYTQDFLSSSMYLSGDIFMFLCFFINRCLCQ